MIPDWPEKGIPVACNKNCGGACALLAHRKNGRITRLSHNPLAGRYVAGCIRGFGMHHALYSPDRLKKPLIRSGPRGSGSFKEVDWPQALHLVAERLSGIKEKFGNQAILYIGGSGATRGALHNTWRLSRRFLGMFGGFTGTLGSYSASAASFVLPYLFGATLPGADAGTLDRSRLIILWGANISDCLLGSEMPRRIYDAKKRGVEIIVIDPRRTNTARRLGTRWIPVNPGADAALMLALLYVLIDEDLVDEAFLERYSVGFQALREYVLGLDRPDSFPKTPAWAEKICGTDSETIIALARTYGRTKPAALIPGLSIQRTIGGEEPLRLAVALQAATGNVGRRGGSSGFPNWLSLPLARVGAMGFPPNPVKAAFPIVRWPDAVLEGVMAGYPSDIRAIYNAGGNYLIQGSDTHKSIRAFEKAEFSVCHDYFLTSTARYCDVVLPATTFLERNDIVHGSGGNYALFSSRAAPPQGDARNDYDIFSELSGLLGFGELFTEGRTEAEWLRRFVEESEIPDYEAFKAAGIYWGKDQERICLSDFVADPVKHPLSTPSGLIELSSQSYGGTGFPAVPHYRGLELKEEYPLRLVTPKSRYRVHSQNDNIPWFKEKEAQTLWINPADAASLKLTQGREAVISSPEGRVRVPVKITEDVMPGVVSLLAGVWPSFDADGTETRGLANVLTSTTPTEPSGGPRTHSVLVRVRPAG